MTNSNKWFILFQVFNNGFKNQNNFLNDLFPLKICNPEYNLDKIKVSLLVKMLRNITNTVAARSLNNYNQITSKLIIRHEWHLNKS